MKDADPNRPQDQAVAMCYSAWRDSKVAASKVMHLQSFLWKDGEVAPCPCEGPKFKSFKWVPELKMPDWATGRLYKFSTLASPITVDGQVFDDAQKNRCAASITGAPISINHKEYNLPGQNVVLDADVEEDRMEGLCYVEDPNLNALYDTGQVAGCSIEYFTRTSIPGADGTIPVKGTLCIGLTFVTRDHLGEGFVLGDPLSTVTAMTTQIADLIKERDQLTVKVRTLELAVPVDDGKPKKPKEYENVPDDEFADTENWKYPIDASHVMAAWSYINVDSNQGDYSSDKWAAMKAKVKAAMKKYGHEVQTLPDGAFAFVGDGERKLQIKDAEDKYDASLLTVAVEELAKTPPAFPETVLPGIWTNLRAGYAALSIEVPEAIVEPKVKTLAELIDPRVAKKLTQSIEKRERWRKRFSLFQEDE